MLTARQAADCFAFIAQNNTGGEPMTPLRLHKMLYFAQGHALERFGRPLFGDEIKAWDFGPVVSSIYERSQRNSNAQVLPVLASKDFDLYSIPMDDFQLILDVFVEYDRYTTSKLCTMSHDPNGPWYSHYNAHSNNTIPTMEIADYFRKHNRPIGIDTLLSSANVSGYIDEKAGAIVLPAEWKCDNA